MTAHTSIADAEAASSGRSRSQRAGSSSTASASPPLRQRRPAPPAGPRSPHRQGSSHTRHSIQSYDPSVTVGPVAEVEQARSFEHPITHDTVMDGPQTRVQVRSAPSSPPDALPSERWRSPEAVIEHIEEPSATRLPPGVLAEHLGDDFDQPMVYDANDEFADADFDMSRLKSQSTAPDRPQIGPGILPKRWLEKLHRHKLFLPVIDRLPRPLPPRTPTTSAPVSPIQPSSMLIPLSPVNATAPSLPPADDKTHAQPPPLTMDEVLDALPGGREQHNEWYFCPECWGWFHITLGDQTTTPALAPIPSGDDGDDEGLHSVMKERSRYRDMTESTNQNGTIHHFHRFDKIIEPTRESRIERVIVNGVTEAFAHMDPSYGEPPAHLIDFEMARERTTALFATCNTNVWVTFDGPVAGQIPRGLAEAFTTEKKVNPGVGTTGTQSKIDAWSLIMTLLQNPLFREKRGWVKMDSATFQRKIGASLRSSHLLYQMGFGCRLEDEGYRVGPLTKGDNVTDEDVAQMNRYMARTWVEVCLYLQRVQEADGLEKSQEFITAKPLESVLDELLGLSNIPESPISYPSVLKSELDILGVSFKDVASTIVEAYDLQVSEDFKNIPRYLGALDKLSRNPKPGHDVLLVKVATEKSLDRHTETDMARAYDTLGITDTYLESIMVAREDLPAEHVYKLHREAMEKALDSDERGNVSRSLELIGRDRGDEDMMKLGKNGDVHLSLESAYREFNLARDSNIDNELLLLQYETWIQDRPSRADHYRMALSIIANAPGEERPFLQAYLSGKDISEFQPPARKDIPAGLKNIGNTCYLNSVLQFLYALKPVREAVMAFDGSSQSYASMDDTDTKSTEKRIKVQSSQRFVALLRQLFQEMYGTDGSAVAPEEELARLAILPVDLIDQRRDAIPQPATKGRVTIDTLPTIHSPVSSGAATAADTGPPSPVSLVASPASSPKLSAAPLGATPQAGRSVLGKRASEDRESVFGGSEERLRRLNTIGSEDLIELDSPTPGSVNPGVGSEDVEMRPPTREGSELLATGVELSHLELASPVAEVPPPPKVEPGLASPAPTPPTSLPALPPRQPPTLPPRPTGQPAKQPPRRRSMALVAAEKFGLQQDAAEILINILAQLEYAFDPQSKSDSPDAATEEMSTQSPNLIQQQQMLLDSGDGLQESHPPVESVFVHPIIGVEEDNKDIYDCLAELYLGGAEIEYEGKKGFKMDLIDELPPMLYIQMRYDFIRQRQVKTNTHIAFDRTLCMDRFLTSADPAKREQSTSLTRKMMGMRQRRHTLKNHKPLPIPDTFRLVRDALGSEVARKALKDEEEITADLLEQLGEEASHAEEDIKELEQGLVAAKQELEALWADEKAVEYELVSVFVHGGTGTGGHYWTYQADLPRDGNKFFYYSDENVKEVPTSDVFSDKSAQGVSPALLCYVRKDHDLVDTLHRKAAEEAAATAADETAAVGVETKY